MFMLIVLISYIITTCACLGITYYVFSQCAVKGEGLKILLLILVSFTPVLNSFFLLMTVITTLGSILVGQLNKQLERRKP